MWSRLNTQDNYFAIAYFVVVVVVISVAVVAVVVVLVVVVIVVVFIVVVIIVVAVIVIVVVAVVIVVVVQDSRHHVVQADLLLSSRAIDTFLLFTLEPKKLFRKWFLIRLSLTSILSPSLGTFAKS